MPPNKHELGGIHPGNSQSFVFDILEDSDLIYQQQLIVMDEFETFFAR